MQPLKRVVERVCTRMHGGLVVHVLFVRLVRERMIVWMSAREGEVWRRVFVSVCVSGFRRLRDTNHPCCRPAFMGLPWARPRQKNLGSVPVVLAVPLRL